MFRLNRETYSKINSSDFRKTLQSTVVRCVECRDAYEKLQLEEQVLSLMEPKVLSLASQNRIYKDDLAQILRICVMETLRRGVKGQLRYDPSKGKPYLNYINASLKLASISFLEKNSSIPANIERALYREAGPYDDTEKEILKSISKPSSLPITAELGMSSASVEEEIDNEERLEREIGFSDKVRTTLHENISDERLAFIILARLRGYAKRDLRKMIKCQWSTLDQLIKDSDNLLEEWRESPPEWLEDLFNDIGDNTDEQESAL